ncbi:MAG TPA: NAD-dependent epimerase/dehydratase family protein [Gemmatimonadales bacterium]|nr:NAD-dependent epimerase/dehydratase family protein [Gemmatimonadales bacterium]
MSSAPITVVTGASGFLGSAVVRHLVAAGRPVRALSRIAREDQPGVEWVRGDIALRASLAGLVPDGALVIHAGASLHGDPALVRRSIVDGTANVAELVGNAGGRMAHVSSLAVISPELTSSRRELDEHAELDPSPQLRGVYSQAKSAAEQVVRDGIAHELDAVILRPGQLVGSGLGSVPPSCGIRVAGLRVLLGSGHGTIPVVHVDDAAEGIILLADRAERGETVHLVDPGRVERLALLRAMRRAGVPGSGAPVLPAVLAARVLARIGPAAAHRLAALDSQATWSASRAILMGWKPSRLEYWLSSGMDAPSDKQGAGR